MTTAPAPLREAIARLDDRLKQIGGCTDRMCVITGPRSGQVTNGGCRCSRNDLDVRRALSAWWEFRTVLSAFAISDDMVERAARAMQARCKDIAHQAARDALGPPHELRTDTTHPGRRYRADTALTIRDAIDLIDARAALTSAGFAVVPVKAIDLAVSRGCDHCADSIREARAMLAAAREA